jgi:hypothetical protein
MSRPPAMPDRESFPEEERAAYDAIADRSRGKFATVTPYNQVLLNSPPFGAALAELGRLARTAGEREGTYSHADRELVDQVLSADWGTNVVLGLHIPDALSAGVRLQAIRALRTGHEDDLSEDEHLLARYVRAVVGGTMTDELYGAMVERLGPRGTVEYTIFIAFLQLTIRLWQAFGMDDPSDEDIARLIDELEGGTRAIPDFRDRIG